MKKIIFVLAIINLLSCKKANMDANYSFIKGKWKSVALVNYDQSLPTMEYTRDYSFSIGQERYHELEFSENGEVRFFKNGKLIEKGDIILFNKNTEYSSLGLYDLTINCSMIKKQYFLEDIYLIEFYQNTPDSLYLYTRKYEDLFFRTKFIPNHREFILYTKP